MKAVFATLLAVALLAAAAAGVVVRLGLYDVSATSPHTRVVHHLLETTMHHSVRRRAAGIAVPPLDDPRRLALGAACYRQHCVQCHGGPGVAQQAIGQAVQPLPGPLADAARRWRPEEVYWITRHGIKMSGMPAWELRLSESELWAVVAFVDRLAAMSPADYARATATATPPQCSGTSPDCSPSAGCMPGATADQQPLQMRDRDEQARLALRQYACSACHRVPGVVGSDTHVGPPLDGFDRRQSLPGGLPNTHANLVRWLREPQAMHPGTAMPGMGLTEHHAHLIANYLLKHD
jgi:mono/diheme cytochrome c family protein